MIDPVDNFKIPEEWIALTKIPFNELEKQVSQGMIVVLSNGSILKRGYTTGTTAAVVAKASVLLLNASLKEHKKNIDHVCVPTPSGPRACLDIKIHDGYAIVHKPQNDHESDITRGLEFRAYARSIEKTNLAADRIKEKEAKKVNEIKEANEIEKIKEIKIIAGEGIGIVVRDGFEVKKGNPAINPVPMQQIRDSVMEAVEEIGLEGVEVTISIPEGAEIAKNTLNERVGVKGGISILGTTGFVEPWNDHLGETKEILLKDTATTKAVLTTGRLGMRYSTMLFPDHTIVMFGSRISEGLAAASGNVEEIVICGLPGLVLKWGDPNILKDSGFVTVSDMITNDPENKRLLSAFKQTVEKADGARVVIVNRSGTVLMDSENVDSNDVNGEDAS